LKSQKPSYIENFSIEDGLSQNSIICLYQSSDGLLWVGTQDGLNLFDGYNFSIYRYNPTNPNSIPNNYINDITEDDKNNILIATREGISIWNRTSNTFTNLKHNPEDKNSLSNNDVLQILYFGGFIWALSDDALDKYVGNGIFEHYYFYKDSTTTRYSYNNLDIINDEKGNIWCATKDGTNIFNPKENQFYRIHENGDNSLSNNRIRALFKDDENNIWIGTFNGLNKYLKSTSVFISYFYYLNKDFIRENTINDIYIDKNKNLWLGTKNGLKSFDGKQITDFDNIILNSIKDQVTQITCDFSGNIWCGTIGNGLYKITMQKQKFENFSDFNNVADKTIFAIYAYKNNIWAGSNGIYIIDKLTKKIIYYNNLVENDTIQEITVYSFYEIDNKLWVGTDNNIFIFDKNTFEYQNFFDYFNIDYQKIFYNNRVSDIKKDREGIYWIATLNGLFRFDGKNIKKFSHNPNDTTSISSNIVTKILLDNNKIWVATYNGLNVFYKKDQKFKKWDSENGLPSIFLLDIEKTDYNTLWISTTSGLSKMNIHEETFLNFNSFNHGFKNDFFYDIIYTNNYMWLSSNYGVVKFNCNNYKFKTYEIKDGLASLECNIGSAFLSEDSTIYFGSINGISWSNLKDTMEIISSPKTVITRIERQGFTENKEVIPFPDTSKSYYFSYKDIITFHFTTPHFSYPEKNRYKYKIVGLSDSWSEEQSANFITLTGLSPGNYTLKIKGANSQETWNNSPAVIKFQIAPPFHRSILAYALYITIFLTLIIFAFLYIYSNIKKENKILQEKNLALEQLDEQRMLLQDKNKNITDSINYAKKIIEAILPPAETLNYVLPESFIFFIPKDIVSGDFYWFKEKNDNIYIAAVDCTGHGIPGAFMSIIGINLLETITNEGVSDPAIFLNYMNKEIISTLKKDMDKKHLKDGMDMTLCIIDKRRKQLKYAGAYNPAYIIRDESIIQLKGDRKSVGNDFELNPFTPFSMKIRENDMVYIFSDGFTDQFGEDSTKKFKFKRFRLLLLSIHKKSMEEQKQILFDNFNQWKGKAEQVDDILVIGFNPLSYENL